MFRPAGSDVTVAMPLGARGSISGTVHTDAKPFLDHIPDDECLVAPIPDFHLGTDTETNSGRFVMKVPHCLNSSDLSSVVVRHGDIHKGKAFAKIPRCDNETEANSWMNGPANGSPAPYSFYWVDDENIWICTQGFSQFICTSCKYECRGQGQAFIFGKVAGESWPAPVASVRLYMCSPLHRIEDYRKVVLAALFKFFTLLRVFAGKETTREVRH